ncbi:MAG: hypothetical protein ABIR57_00665 [Aeromicrobium sp.]
MITLEDWALIRRLHLSEKLPKAEIARDLERLLSLDLATNGADLPPRSGEVLAQLARVRSDVRELFTDSLLKLLGSLLHPVQTALKVNITGRVDVNTGGRCGGRCIHGRRRGSHGGVPATVNESLDPPGHKRHKRHKRLTNTRELFPRLAKRKCCKADPDDLKADAYDHQPMHLVVVAHTGTLAYL